MVRPFVRVDVWSLPEDDPVLTAYGDAVTAMQAKPRHDPTSWAYQAAIHGTLSPTPRAAWNQCRHGTWYFVAWHRMYVYYFERIVRAQVVALGGPHRWALPYWDYDGGGDHNTLPPAFRRPARPDGTPNPLYVSDRNPGINAGGGLPSSITSAAFALTRPVFTGASEFGGGATSPLGQFWSSTGRLEQTPHNDVHVAVGGLMGDPDTAARDPIFWLHHANIDRLWWLWQKHNANPTRAKWTGQAFHFRDVDGSAASLTCADVERIDHQLQYTYDQPAVQAATPPMEVQQLNVQWPRPWPRRPDDAARPGPQPDGSEVLRTLVGGTEEPVVLTGDPVRARVVVDARATESLLAGTGLSEPQHRAFLDVEDIEAERNPGVVYGVYVNLPDDPAPDDLSAHHVGNVALFGVERARNPRGDEHGHGLRLSMEITELLDRLSSDGSWHDGTALDVVFRPITLEPPTDGTDAGEQAMTAHAELPVTIGRVSVHFA